LWSMDITSLVNNDMHAQVLYHDIGHIFRPII
jgi:hypothetical protein